MSNKYICMFPAKIQGTEVTVNNSLFNKKLTHCNAAMQRSLLLKILLSLEVIRIYTIEDGVTIKYGVCKFLLVLHCN